MEDISLPAPYGKEDNLKIVDVIISEWMGYALLYESMLDSVLAARDRFLAPGGIMAPSECRMMLALAKVPEVWKDRVSFWDDVYGKRFHILTAKAQKSRVSKPHVLSRFQHVVDGRGGV